MHADHTTSAAEKATKQWNLSAYVATYLELAMRRQLPLASLDSHLVAAAAGEGVALIDGWRHALAAGQA